jgi:hypothetical protein
MGRKDRLRYKYILEGTKELKVECGQMDNLE